MQLINGIFTVALFLCYILLWYIKQQEMLRSEGIDVNVIFKAKRPIQVYFASLEKLMTLFLVIIITAHLLLGEKWLPTNTLALFDTLPFKIVGVIVGILGLMLCRIAQVTIGKSWRVGIDEPATPGLITKGIYSFMRNPTYTGLYVMCAGVWIINPTILYSFWIVIFFIMMEFQVRCEEEYLEEKYGNSYLDYCKKTKRYIPFIY
jgi:protein-S-isoprenylcysteine O-methyltransferase Ste14